MQSQNSAYSNPRFADFTSAMMRASVPAGTAPQKRDDTTRSRQHQGEAATFRNRNLSSILSRIADDGPADMKPAPQKVDRVPGKRAVKSGKPVRSTGSRTAAANPSAAEPYVFAQSFSFDDPDIRNTPEQAGRTMNTAWQQVVPMVLFAVIAVMGFFLYQLKMQTDDMKLALEASQEQVQPADGIQAPSLEVMPKLNSLNRALSDLKQEMQGIKNGYQRSDSKLAVEIPRDLEPRLLEIAAATEIVSVLQDEFERIQDEMREMGGELKVIRQEMAAPEPAMPDTGSLAEPAQAIPNLVVNLASLTSKDKALAAMEKLQQAGVAPLMQQVMVNGQIVFRISVDGFSSRAAASSFIAEAKNKYGFDGGWIRPI